MTFARLRPPLRLLSSLVLGISAALSVAGFFVTRSVVADEQHRLLRDRGEEVGLILESLFAPVGTELSNLSSSVATRPGATSEFIGEARGDLGLAAGFGALQDTSGVYRSLASLGTGLAPGTVAPLDRSALAARALSTKGLVEAVVPTAVGPRVSFALGAGPGIVVYEDLAFDPNKPINLGSSGPFSNLDGALYDAPQPSPAALIITTTERLPLRGQVSSQMVTVDQQHWLLVVKSRHSLVGSLAATAPWALLGGGLVATALATLLVETLSRRRSYAVALVAERTAALREAEASERQARETAEAANHAKSEFLSRMSHELRTPLNAVIGFGQLLQLDELDSNQQEAVDQILQGGRHLLGLINEVLDISRIETGNLPLSPEAVSADEAIADVIVLMRPLAQERGIHLNASGIDAKDRPSTFVLADRQRLKQILLNLVSNAIKYNHDAGTVTVSVEQQDRGRQRIVVADTGQGIRNEDLPKLFTPFERLGAEQTQVEGVGVGLALARRLAEAMGGTLDVTTQFGEGSSFWVELPVTEGPVERYERLQEQPGERALSPTVKSPHQQTVLYIEDNLSNLRLIERLLAERDDLQVVPAIQGRLGLSLAREYRPIVILLDLHLPDMPGEQVLRQLREDPATISTPVIVLSADATPGQIERLMSAGANAYLTKPLDIRQLVAVLSEHLAGANIGAGPH